MSLVLTNAGEKLEIVATVVIPFVVHYADYVGATPAFTPGVAGGDTINGTKDLLAAPGSGQRVVRTISVHNDSGGADTITIQLDDAGVNYTIVTVALPDNYALYYDEDGWKVLDDNGSLVTVVSAHTLLGPYHSDTATNAPSRGSIIVADSSPDWDELVHPGISYHFQTDLNDATWGLNLPMVNGAWVGISGDLRVKFDQTNGEIELHLGDALGADEVQVVDSGGAPVLKVDSDGNVTVVDGAIIGIGPAAERIVFDAAGDITVMGAKFGVNTAAPNYRIEVNDDVADFIGKFFNDGNNDNRWGFIIQCGLDTNPTNACRFINFSDGNGTTVGTITGDGSGGVLFTSVSDERLKNILGPIDQDRAMKALIEVDPIQYVGKGLTAETGQKAVGFSAQAMLKHFPEVVGHDKERDEYTIGYERLVPVLWSVCQSLLKRIEQLEK